MTPDFIRESEFWGPLYALGVFAALTLVAAIVQVALQIVIRRRTRDAPDALDTRVLATVKGPAVLFIVLLGMFLGFLVLTGLTSSTYDALDGWDKWVRRAWGVVVIAEVSYLASQMTQILIAWYVRTIAARTATDLDAKLLPPLKRVLPMTIYAVGTLVALDSLDVSISPLLAGLGIGGLAVALAVQPTLSNFFAGTYLITEGELKVGDYIELADGGPAGFVVDVGWRSTKIRIWLNNLVIIPNSTLSQSIVTNYYSPTTAMNVLLNCGVSYDSDLAHVERVVVEELRGVIEESEYAVKDAEPFFEFSEFGDSNINFFVFVQATDRRGSFTLASEVIKRIHSRFKGEGIEINYPVRKLVPSTNGLVPVVGTPEPPAEQAAESSESG